MLLKWFSEFHTNSMQLRSSFIREVLSTFFSVPLVMFSFSLGTEIKGVNMQEKVWNCQCLLEIRILLDEKQH